MIQGGIHLLKAGNVSQSSSLKSCGSASPKVPLWGRTKMHVEYNLVCFLLSLKNKMKKLVGWYKDCFVIASDQTHEFNLRND